MRLASAPSPALMIRLESVEVQHICHSIPDATRPSGAGQSTVHRTSHKNIEEFAMILQDWIAPIHQMIEESNNAPKESGKQKILTEWRSKLEKAPYLLKSFQIDEIVREVRKGLTSDNLQTAGSPQYQR
jgi:hypothetical protein